MDFEKIKDMPPEELADLIFEEELPSCPFCGGEPKQLNMFEKMKDTFGLSLLPKAILETLTMGFIVCPDCGATVSGSTIQEVKEKWKRRVSNEK